MKIYCFYLVKKEIDTSKFLGVTTDKITFIGNNECALYAYTPAKESEIYFLETRNMDIFFEKIIEMDREDYEEFCENNKDQLLEYHTFVTKNIEHGVYKSKSIQILTTLIESDHIIFYKEEIVMDMISNLFLYDMLDVRKTLPFKKSIKKVLNEYFIYEELLYKVYPLEDMNYDKIFIDDLSLYIKLFSNTFKKGY